MTSQDRAEIGSKPFSKEIYSYLSTGARSVAPQQQQLSFLHPKEVVFYSPSCSYIVFSEYIPVSSLSLASDVSLRRRDTKLQVTDNLLFQNNKEYQTDKTYSIQIIDLIFFFPRRSKRFLSTIQRPARIQSPTVLLSNGCQGHFSPRLKRPRCDADHSHTSDDLMTRLRVNGATLPVRPRNL